MRDLVYRKWDRNLTTIVIGGLAASIVMGMWQMVVEALLPDGTGFFGPLVAIGATIVRDLQGTANPLPVDIVALVLGAAGHMMNSVVLAFVFGTVAPRYVRGTLPLAVAGMAYGVVVFVITWFIIVPLIDPLMHNVNGVVFFLGHLMWGLALGWLWARFGMDSRAGIAESGGRA